MHKYFKATLPMVQYQSQNTSFSKLLEFIGEHKRIGSRNAIGSAYIAIKNKTDELLGLSGNYTVTKTSKKEVASIRFYYNRSLIVKSDNERFVKIPFKIAYIFKAIDILVKDICDAGHEIPIDLLEYVHKTYRESFYSVHVEAYDNCRNDIPISMVTQRALNDDLHGAFSPLNSQFVRKE